MIKRLCALLLALVCVISLSACGEPATDLSQRDPLSTTLDLADGSGPAASEPTASEPAASEPDTPEPAASEPAETEQSPSQTGQTPPPQEAEPDAPAVDEDGWYNTKEEVALYIHLYGHLPENYVTKREAEAMGWSGGSVERYAGEGTAIGGNRFGNYEGLLPEADGRTYTECDIDTVGRSSRGARRVVFSNDGLIYYTGDHYESFELLYGGS